MAKKAAAATKRTMKKPAAATAAVKKKPAARAEKMNKPATGRKAPAPALQERQRYREDCLGNGVEPESFLQFLGPLLSIYLALKTCLLLAMFSRRSPCATQVSLAPAVYNLSEPEKLQPEEG